MCLCPLQVDVKGIDRFPHAAKLLLASSPRLFFAHLAGNLTLFAKTLSSIPKPDPYPLFPLRT